MTSHRQMIKDLLGSVPESWEDTKAELLEMPAESELADYVLHCMSKVEDGQGDPSWVTLPRLIQMEKISLRVKRATKEYRAAWMQKHAHLGPRTWSAAYAEEFLE